MLKDCVAYEDELKIFLIKLQITPNYRGYGYIVFIMRLIFDNPERLQHITKELYMITAQHYSTDRRAVEHSIRIAVSRSCYKNPDRFKNLFMGWVKQRPSTGKFLAFLYTYLYFVQEGKKIEGTEKNI